MFVFKLSPNILLSLEFYEYLHPGFAHLDGVWKTDRAR